MNGHLDSNDIFRKRLEESKKKISYSNKWWGEEKFQGG